MGNSQGKEIRTGRMTVRIKDILYEDSYWKVYVAQDVETNQEYDVRVASFEEGDVRSLNRLKQEIAVWKHMPVHDNLIQYYDSDIVVTDDVVQGVIITEHCEGGLISNVVTETYPQTLSEKMILGILRDLLCALFTLHTSDPPISHRNITPNYIYVHSSGRCKLEAARSMTSNIITPKNLEELQVVQQQLELVSDPAYFPPEFCDLDKGTKKRKITEKVDVWELGVFLYYLAFYSTPFETVDGKINMTSLMAGKVTFPSSESKSFSNEFLSLIKRLLTADVAKRPSIIDLIQECCTFTRWRMTDEVKEALEIINKMKSPSKEKKKKVVKKVKEKTVSTQRSASKTTQKNRSSTRSAASQPSQPSVSSQRSQLALSESDISSDSEGDSIVRKREAGEMNDKVRASMLQYFGGRQNHTRWVAKCTSRVPEPPSPRTIKKIAIAAYENRSIDFYFVLLAKRPLFADEVVAVKALTTTLCIFQLSTQDVIIQSFKHVSLLKEISTRWKIVEESEEKGKDMNWAPFISRLANILTNKVYFLNKYTEFGVNYALEEGSELDVEDQVNVPARLSTLLANLNMSLRWSLANTGPVINGAIRPMIEEAHSLYLSLTVVMADLLNKNDEPDIIQSNLARYDEERLALREIILRAKGKQDLNLFDDIPDIPAQSPLQQHPRQARAAARKMLDSFMSVGDSDMLAEADLDEEDSESSENEDNVHILGKYYKLTARGAIVPLVHTVANSYSEGNTHEALKKVMSSKENKVCCECGRSPVKYMSVNLGIFLCATCQRIHLQLGETISEVHSISAKVLKSEWIVTVAEIGNKKARAFWEKQLPEEKRPSLSDTPSVWASFLKQKYIQHLWIPSVKRKVKNEEKHQSMEDLIDLDFSGFGPETVRMDDAWCASDPFGGNDKNRRMPPQRGPQPPPAPMPPKSLFSPGSPFHAVPPTSFPQQNYVSPTGPTGPTGPMYTPPQEAVSMFNGGSIFQHPVEYHPVQQPPPTQPMQQGPYPPPFQQPFIPPQQQSPAQTNFSIDYMFSASNTQPEPASGPLIQQSYVPPPYQPPVYQPPFIPSSPSLTAVKPQQPPSVIGQHRVEAPPMVSDTTKTTIVPLMNPAREGPVSVHHQRGLSSVVHNASVVEDNSTEDEEDYEARIENDERKTDEKVKRKVMSALQSALSDLQLTGIQVKWSDIEVDDRIGVGGFAIVYHGMYRGCEVAVKKIRVSRMSAKAIRDFHSEVALMRALRHPNIVIFMGLVMDPVCLVTEYCHNGNLFDLLHDTIEDDQGEHYAVKIPWQRRVRIALDVARGMNFLHTSTPVIIHRDLKSLNILVDEKWTAKVSDFGLSRFKSATAHGMMTGQCGTYQWMAPEVIGGHIYTEKADVFSFGINLWELLTRKIPYDGMQPMQVAMMVHTHKKRLPIPDSCPEWYATLIKDCWDQDPDARPSFAEIIKRLKRGGPAPTVLN